MTAIAQLPPTALLGIVRNTLKKERGFRVVARINDKQAKIAEIDHALDILDIIEKALREKAGS